MLTAILEGCDHDTPSILTFAELNHNIPENAQILLINNTKLLLKCRTDFKKPEPIRYQKPEQSIKGIELYDPESKNPRWLNWTFEMPRSVICKDGRFYLNEVFYKPNWGYYEPHIQEIIKAANKVFSGSLSVAQLNKQRARAF